MSMNNNNEEANVIVVKETLKQQCSDDKEIIEDDTKANLKGNNDAPRNIAEPPDARKATTAPGYSRKEHEASYQDHVTEKERLYSMEQTLKNL